MKAAAQTILERSVCLVLRCSYLGSQKKVRLDDIGLTKAGEDVKAAKDQLTLSKRLYDADLLRAVNGHYASVQVYLKAVSTNALGVFGAGTYLVALARAEEVETRLGQFKTDIASAVKELVTAYPAAVEARRAVLGDLWDEMDYLPADQVAQQFGFSWSYVSFDAPDNLKSVSASMHASEKAKYAEKMTNAFDLVRQQLRAHFYTVAQELNERLAPRDDGKKRRIHEGCLRPLLDFLNGFTVDDLTSDEKLGSIVDTMRKQAAGITAELLREDEEVKDDLAASAAAAVAALEPLIETSLDRGIRLL